MFTMTKQCYIHSRLDVVLCLPFHVHDRVENVLKHVFFYVHDVKVMVEEIGLSIRKLPKNTSIYLVVGQTKIKKLLLIGLKSKHNVTVLWHHVIHFFTGKTWGCNILFNSAIKKNPFCSFYICDSLARNTGGSKKKDALPLFVSMNALLISIQYGHAGFPYVFQPETIS